MRIDDAHDLRFRCSVNENAIIHVQFTFSIQNRQFPQIGSAKKSTKHSEPPTNRAKNSQVQLEGHRIQHTRDHSGQWTMARKIRKNFLFFGNNRDRISPANRTPDGRRLRANSTNSRISNRATSDRCSEQMHRENEKMHARNDPIGCIIAINRHPIT